MQTAKRYEARFEFVFDGDRLAPMARHVPVSGLLGRVRPRAWA
jgi:hypothetical protein